MSPIEVPAKIQLVEKRETRTSRGMLSKGWYHVDEQLVMVKGNSITEAGTAGYEPYSEVMASLIAQVLGLPHVEYALMPAKLFPDIRTYSCDVVSVCPKFTTDDEQLYHFADMADAHERLLNCKMIFQLLYWAYQNFFREDAAMTAQTMQIGNRPCRIYGEAHAEYLLLQMTGEHELQSMESEIAAIAQSAHHFLFAAIPVESWNDALSPWEAPAVWGKQGFGGKAVDTLCFLTEQVIPTLKQQFRLPEDVKIILGGYSLAGLFALWASTQTDLFYGVAAASPSVWFPGWMEFEQQHPMQAQHVYLSLGDKEERTKNAVMAAVGDHIRTLHSRLTERGADCTLEWNSGGHFKDADLRTAKAFRWAMEEHT